jgi:hypothetical protein
MPAGYVACRFETMDSPTSVADASVRFWHKADITIALGNVRFWGKADMATSKRDVCF